MYVVPATPLNSMAIACITTSALARSGKKVVQADEHGFYGYMDATVALMEFQENINELHGVSATAGLLDGTLDIENSLLRTLKRQVQVDLSPPKILFGKSDSISELVGWGFLGT